MQCNVMYVLICILMHYVHVMRVRARVVCPPTYIYIYASMGPCIYMHWASVSELSGVSLLVRSSVVQISMFEHFLDMFVTFFKNSKELR